MVKLAKERFYAKYGKRWLDIFCALIALILFGWLYLVLIVLVRSKLGRPVFFAQERPGKNEKIFKLIKFRSMTNARDAKGKLLSDDERLTKFGRFLRSTSLDELPEVFNILKGEMSVVGPRPLLVQYLPYYTEEERRRHDVRPGLTGWAQINGRNTLTWDEKFALDVEYVDKCSFWFDLKIICITIVKTIKRSDIQVGNEYKGGSLPAVRADKVKF